MNRNFGVVAVQLLIILSLAISCNSHNSKSKIIIRTMLPTIDMAIKSGDKIDFSIVTNHKIDSAQLFIEGQYISSSKNGKFRHTLSENETIGEKNYKIIAFGGGTTGERSGRFMTLPVEDSPKKEAKKVSTLAHSRDSYTQGLEFFDGKLYQSSGQYGRSFVEILEFPSMKRLKRVDLESKYFAEGITILDGKLYLLTWKEKKAFVYDAKSLEKIGEFSYDGEGWGLTNDGEYLYMSDGSSSIYKIDPETFNRIDKIEVITSKGVITNINELEWVDGKIYANVYGYDSFLIINPSDGLVEKIVFCNSLLSSDKKDDNTDVFNGIAYDKNSKKLYVTGKNWPEMYEINGY